MKCVHCSGPVGTGDWFCPHCKRSVPRRRWAIRRAPALRLGLLTAGTGGMLWLGVALGRTSPGTAAAGSAPPEIRIQPHAAPAVVPVATTATPRLLPPRRRRILAASVRTAEPQPRPEAAGDEVSAAPNPGHGTVSFFADWPDTTFVYVDGGTLLGQTPLTDITLAAGRHEVLFWSPGASLRRTIRIEVPAGDHLELTPPATDPVPPPVPTTPP